MTAKVQSRSIISCGILLLFDVSSGYGTCLLFNLNINVSLFFEVVSVKKIRERQGKTKKKKEKKLANDKNFSVASLHLANRKKSQDSQEY